MERLLPLRLQDRKRVTPGDLQVHRRKHLANEAFERIKPSLSPNFFFGHCDFAPDRVATSG
jgi:hypothetical protein